MLIASDERVLCWGKTLLAHEDKRDSAGNEHLSTGDECVENACSRVSDTHTASYTQLVSSDFKQNLCQHDC